MDSVAVVEEEVPEEAVGEGTIEAEGEAGEDSEDSETGTTRTVGVEDCSMEKDLENGTRRTILTRKRRGRGDGRGSPDGEIPTKSMRKMRTEYESSCQH